MSLSCDTHKVRRNGNNSDDNFVGNKLLLLQTRVPVGPVPEHLPPCGAVRVLVLAHGLRVHLGAVAKVRRREVTEERRDLLSFALNTATDSGETLHLCSVTAMAVVLG